MSIQKQDEDIGEGSERRTAVADRPVARQDSEQVEEQVVHSTGSSWELARSWVRSLGALILVALAVVETLLVFRLGFLLADANSSNGFVNFIYDVSKPLAEPFQGIIADSGNLEFASPIAMVAYLFAALLMIAGLFAITSGPSGDGGSTVTRRTEHSNQVVR